MSDKLAFGRDISEFLRSCGEPVADDKISDPIGNGIRLQQVKSSGNGAVTLKISVSNDSGSEEIEYTLLCEHFEALKIGVGTLEDCLMPEIEYWSEVAKAYFSACASFACAPSSLSALKKKLFGKNFPSDIADDAINSLKKAGIVNESQIALRRAQILTDKRWGRSRVLAKLKDEGFYDRSIDDAVAFLNTVDFAENCAAVIMRKFGGVPEDRHERELMFASLSRMGYSASDIREAQKKLK